MPDLYYKTFDVNDNITSGVIPVNEECFEIKNVSKPKKKVWIERVKPKISSKKILDSCFSGNIKKNMMKLYEEIGTRVEILVSFKFLNVQKLRLLHI